MSQTIDPLARWRRLSTGAPAAATVPAEPCPVETPIAAADGGAQSFDTSFHVFMLLTFILVGRPQDFFPVLNPLRLAFLGTLLAIAATVFSSVRPARGLLASRESRLYLLFYAAMIGGIPFGVYRPGAFDAVIMRYSVNIAFFVLFLVHVDSVAKLKRIAIALVMAVFMLSVFGLRDGVFSGGRYVTGSLMYDPNDVAFVEVSLLGFALWVLMGSFGILMKAAALTSLIGGTLLILFTASRGGLLGLATFVLLFMLLRVNKVKKSFKLLVIVLLVVAAYTQWDKINLERYMTLGSIEDDYNFEEGGRADIWKRGWKLFLADPLTGVGVDGFGKAIGDMRAAEYGQIPKWQTAHSSYVLVLTETGIVGITAFVLLILNSLITFNRLRRRGSGIADPELQALPGLLLVGFGAQLVAAAFLSQAYSPFFTLVFAMSAALDRMTMGPAPAPASEAPAGQPTRFAPRAPGWISG